MVPAPVLQRTKSISRVLSGTAVCGALHKVVTIDAITICNQDNEVGQEEMLGNLDLEEAPTKVFYHEPWDLWHTFLSYKI